ncbi:MAG: hypothetical protein ACD_15C00100G0002 [uncultured bacterium]|nr:MAG: hypothetical protein ACD_15C00100G0002 [uncultured bacterium]KKT88968.1 MAG: hypothetical protein UW87_C0009G0032 [Candidatus Moranbacteria bacterium GW2011_GWC2_45_10]KKT95112.1 MAG: hypothetical protein UW95_C0004G0030 [Parcubacteria group bacterium GW2011_GWC1_45_14]HAV11258.1 hypothetical protein [Candidatus Moranbacteria bacterium]
MGFGPFSSIWQKSQSGPGQDMPEIFIGVTRLNEFPAKYIFFACLSLPGRPAVRKKRYFIVNFKKQNTQALTYSNTH